MKSKRLNGFDLGIISKYRSEIFGITISWIVILHGVIMDKVTFSPNLEWLYIILKHGNVGVDIFLFLSGIGLYYSFSKDNDVGRYMKKRMSRVLIPYLIIGGIYFLYKDVELNNSVTKFLADISLISFLFKGNKIVWYIFAIMLCYIIFPYVYRLIYDEKGNYKKSSSANLVFAIILVILMTFVIYLSYRNSYDHIEAAITRIPVFMCGCACAGLIKQNKKISYIWPVLAFLVVATSYSIFKRYLITGIYQRYYYCLYGVSLTVLFALVLSVIKWKPIHTVFSWLGNISLELYLCHILLRDLFIHSRYYSGGHIMLKYVVVVIISVVLAKIVSVFVSKLKKC